MASPTSPCKSQSQSQSSSSSCLSVVEEDDQNGLRRGPWTVDEDSLLIHSVSVHGEGRWNLLAIRSGLKRTGKSCRLRWLNYLKPDVKRGNLSPQEQLLILDLHSRWGNRWSKIVQNLPGRTDNEIKNYWRTRVQKQAKLLKIDPNGAEFKDVINRIWIPRLVRQINESTTSPPATRPTPDQLSAVDSPPASNEKLTGSESVEDCGGVVAPAGFEYPINYCGFTDWIDDHDSFGGCLWNNVDELWQF